PERTQPPCSGCMNNCSGRPPCCLTSTSFASSPSPRSSWFRCPLSCGSRGAEQQCTKDAFEDSMDFTDEQLVDAARAGEQDAFSELFTRHHGRLLKLALQH